MSSEQNLNPKPSSSLIFSLLASDHDRSSFSVAARASGGGEGIRAKGEERMGKVYAVVFDMDGVLCNNEESSRKATIDVFIEMEVLFTTEDFIPFIGTGFGFSDKPQPKYGFDYTLDEFVSSMELLIDALGLDKLSLVVQILGRVKN